MGNVPSETGPSKRTALTSMDEVRGCFGVFTEDDSCDGTECEAADLEDVEGESSNSPIRGVLSFRILRQRMTVVIDWANLLSVTCTDGSIPFTMRQYDVMVKAVSTCGNGIGLKGVRSVRQNVRRNMLPACYAYSE